VYGKITEIIRNAPTGARPVKKITYSYDAAGNRISKKVEKSSTNAVEYTWYMRDAAGNVMSTYSYTSTTATDITANKLTQNEVYLYGSSKLGSLTTARDAEVTKQPEDFVYGFANTIDSAYRTVFKTGLKQYELSNHLGNVLVTISDKKIGIDVGLADGIIDYYTADVITANDYYPFGMAMPGRSYNASSYLYGFNGKELDPNMDGNNYDYGFRIYNPQIARFLSVDPLTNKYPELTPYQFASNRPIDGIDQDGLEYQAINAKGDNIAATDKKDIAGYKFVGFDKDAKGNLVAKPGTVNNVFTYGVAGRTLNSTDSKGGQTSTWQSYESIKKWEPLTD